MISLETKKLALELSAKAGRRLRADLLSCGLTESEIEDVMREAFAWLHAPNAPGVHPAPASIKCDYGACENDASFIVRRHPRCFAHRDEWNT